MSDENDSNNGGSHCEDEEGGGELAANKRFKGEELATKVLNIQSKRFYLDVKHNDRGRFIKFAEVAGGGKKSRIFMSMRASNTFKELLDKFIEEVEKLKPEKSSNGKNIDPRNLLHSETIVSDRRRYFLDLRENSRGRFLRITQSDALSGNRFSIAIPSEGLVQLRDALADLVEEFGEGYMDEPAQVELPESRNLRSENKHFYFDPGHNERGDYLKISEVKPSINARQSITVSLRALPSFIGILTDLQSRIEEMRAAPGAEIKPEPAT